MGIRWIALGCVLAMACGDDSEGVDAGRDAGPDAGRDASSDAGRDASSDAAIDANLDTNLDTGTRDSGDGGAADTGECSIRCGEACVDSCGECPGAPLDCDGTCVPNCDGDNCPVGAAMRDSFACGDRCVPFPFCCACEGDAFRCRDGSCVADCSTCTGQRTNCEFGYCTVGTDSTSCRPTEVSCEGCPEGSSICDGTCVSDCAECADRPFSCAPRSGSFPQCRVDVWDCDSPPEGRVRCPDGSVDDDCTTCAGGDSLLKCNTGGWCVDACADCEMSTRAEPDPCGSICVDFSFDFDNCGMCGRSCATSGPPFLECIDGDCLEF